ncbi:MAG: S9 family peptidase [Sedimentisphaerales bacterium]|nr:S9 family peptidase [Sedimentisphaerales bacterium]
MRKLLGILFSAFILFQYVDAAWPHAESDPYLWLEEVEGQKALDWVRSKNEATLAVLKARPEYEQTYDKALEILNSDERIAYPQILGNYIYNFWQDKNNERGIWRRTTLAEYLKPSPQWEVLLDIDKLCEEEGEQWVYKGADGLYPDYELFIVYLSRGGGDAAVAREFDVETKEFIQGGFYLPEAKGSLSWKDRDTVYVQTDFGQGSLTESGYPRITKIWKRGTQLSSAKVIFEGQKSDVYVMSGVINTPERQYDIIHRGITFYTSNTYVIEDGKTIQLDIPDDADFGGFFKNQMLIMLKSDWTIGGQTFKQGSLISIDYDNYLQGGRTFQLVAEPSERFNIVRHSNTKNLLLVNTLNNVRTELYQYRLEGGNWQKEKVDAPGMGTFSVTSTDENSDRYFLNYQDFLTPTSLYYVSEERERVKAKSLPAFFDGNDLEVKQFEAVSKDGTKIPYFLVQPKGIILNGSNPTLLNGYGGFEVSRLPYYSDTLGAGWLERGGVYVLANIRGGGEFGPKWHQSALKNNRQRCYDDFIAVAEDLIKRKITSPEHLGIMGGSNGGLLVGAVFTQRPELFNAVVCQVPLLDMKRYNKLLAGASWMAEYGNPDIPEQWAYIRNYSPYHNVFADKKYPHVFFYTSTRDDRVHPGHARKMVAKMEDMGHKVYYYENTEGGHAAAVTNRQRAMSNALTYAYLWMQLK